MKRFLAFPTIVIIVMLAVAVYAASLGHVTTVTTVAVPANTATIVLSTSNGPPRLLTVLVNQGTNAWYNRAYYGRTTSVSTNAGVLLVGQGGSITREGANSDNGDWYVFSPNGTEIGVEHGYQQ